jgi:F-type H+-transporting ATPase subunit gamma
LLALRPRKRVEVLVLTGDRGLCGAFNSNILKAGHMHVDSFKKEGFDVSISTVGKRGLDYFRRREISVRQFWVGLSGRLTYSEVLEIANDIKENYINGTFDEVMLIYNEFKSMVAQKISIVRLLPLAQIEGEEEESPGGTDFIYEPSRGEIFDQLLPKNVDIQIYRALLESSAAEEAARMTAMENATQNCDEMVSRLTLQYNKARQAGITKELMDIVGGVEALT